MIPLRLPVAVLAAGALLALAGCHNTTSSGAGEATGSHPAASSSAASAAVTPTSAPTAAAPISAGYPTDAEHYAQAAMAAWVSNDHTRLGQLTAGDGAHIFQTLSTGNYDRHFTLQNCQGAAGSTFCTFYNKVGDILRLRLANPALGGPHAIVGGTFEPIAFPDDDKAYAQEALNAWQSGNSARLKLLTTADAYQHISAIAAGQKSADWTYDHTEGAAGSSYLTWKNPAGDSLVFRFVNPGIQPNQGPQHRIIDVLFMPHP